MSKDMMRAQAARKKRIRIKIAKGAVASMALAVSTVLLFMLAR